VSGGFGGVHNYYWLVILLDAEQKKWRIRHEEIKVFAAFASTQLDITGIANG
jgi:hypothetical protein